MSVNCSSSCSLTGRPCITLTRMLQTEVLSESFPSYKQLTMSEATTLLTSEFIEFAGTSVMKKASLWGSNDASSSRSYWLQKAIVIAPGCPAEGDDLHANAYNISIIQHL